MLIFITAFGQIRNHSLKIHLITLTWRDDHGWGSGARTHILLINSQALSQFSYTPIFCFDFSLTFYKYYTIFFRKFQGNLFARKSAPGERQAPGPDGKASPSRRKTFPKISATVISPALSSAYLSKPFCGKGTGPREGTRTPKITLLRRTRLPVASLADMRYISPVSQVSQINLTLPIGKYPSYLNLFYPLSPAVAYLSPKGLYWILVEITLRRSSALLGLMFNSHFL